MFGKPLTPKPGEAAPPPRRFRPGASVTDTIREIKTVHINTLNMSDPFILADEATKTHYLTSSGGAIYKSTHLKNWTGPYSAYDTRGTWMEGIPHHLDIIDGTKVYDAIEKYINLRYSILPYVYSASRDVTANQSGMMRALVIDFASDKKALVWIQP